MLPLPTLGAFHPRMFGVGPADKVGKEETIVLVFVDLRVSPMDMSLDELWYIWEEEAKATLEAMEAGKVVSFYKISGQW